MATKEKKQLSEVLGSITQFIEQSAEKNSLSVKIDTEVFLSNEMTSQLLQSEPAGMLRAFFCKDNVSFQLIVRVIFDGFGFVGVELFSTPDIIDLGLKMRRAKAALHRVISAYVASIYSKKVKLLEGAKPDEFLFS